MMNKALRIDLDIRLAPEKEAREETLQRLDALTSQFITYGGCISAKDRNSLSKISPHLHERMAGRSGLELQAQIKESFDPNNCLNRDEFIDLSARQSKGAIEKFRDHNKQFNYILNLAGLGK